MTKYYVFVIQPFRFHRTNKELGPIGVGAGVGHGQRSRFRVFKLEVFVLEFIAEDAFPATTVSAGEITSLAHELGNDPVETRPFVAANMGLLRHIEWSI